MQERLKQVKKSGPGVFAQSTHNERQFIQPLVRRIAAYVRDAKAAK